MQLFKQGQSVRRQKDGKVFKVAEVGGLAVGTFEGSDYRLIAADGEKDETNDYLLQNVPPPFSPIED